MEDPQIFMLLFGVFLGGIASFLASWYFFHEQQKTNYSELSNKFEKLNAVLHESKNYNQHVMTENTRKIDVIHNHIGLLSSNIDIKDDIKNQEKFSEKLVELSSNLDTMNNDISNLFKGVIEEIQSQDVNIAEEIHKKVETQVTDSLKLFEKVAEEKMSKLLVPDEKEKLLKDLSQAFLTGADRIDGSFKKAIKEISKKVSKNLEEKIEETLTDVTKEISSEIVDIKILNGDIFLIPPSVEEGGNSPDNEKIT